MTKWETLARYSLYPSRVCVGRGSAGQGFVLYHMVPCLGLCILHSRGIHWKTSTLYIRTPDTDTPSYTDA